MQKLLFFQAAAVILPVLVLAALVEFFAFPESQLRGGDRRFTAVLLLLILVFFAVAAGTEVVALSVLLNGKPTAPAKDIVTLGLIFNSMVLALGPVRRVAGGLDEQGWGWIGWLGMLMVVVAGLVGMALVGNGWVGWVVAAVVLIGGVAGIVWDARRDES